MNPASKLKVASRKSATKVLQKAVSDGTISKEELIDLARSDISANGTTSQVAVARRALSSLQAGKIDKNVYDLMNMSMVLRTSTQKNFTEALKKAGYDAIKDRNDTVLSGYGSKTATIILDTAKLKTKSIDEISEQRIQEGAKAVQNRINRSAYTTLASVTASPFVVALANKRRLQSRSVQRKSDEFVKQYRKEHPNSKLTYNEILKIKESSES